MIDVQQLLERAVGEPTMIDVEAVGRRVDQRRRHRRGMWVASVLVIVVGASTTVLAVGETTPEKLATAGLDTTTTTEVMMVSSTGPTTSIADIPEGWESVTFNALHEGPSVTGPVKLWYWDGHSPDPDDPGPDPEPHWDVLYTGVELNLVDGTTEVSPGVFASLLTTAAPPGAARQIAQIEVDSRWLAVSTQTDDPTICGTGADEIRSCPGYPTFLPPGYVDGQG